MNGIQCSKQKFEKSWSDKFPELQYRVLSLEHDKKGVLWASTPFNSLLRITVNNGEVLSVESLDHFFDNKLKNVQSLYIDSNDNIWIATNNGVYSYTHPGVVHYFGVQDGLINADVNCVLVEKDTLWAGTINGLSCIPLSTNASIAHSKVKFSSIRYHTDRQNVIDLLWRSENESNRLSVDPNATSIILELADQDYNDLYDDDFICLIYPKLGNLQNITFNQLSRWYDSKFSLVPDTLIAEKGILKLDINLPAGRYDIQAFTKSKSGDQKSYSSIFTINKPPYWYQTIWFWLTILALICFVVFRIVNNPLRLKRLQSQISELRLQSIQSQLNPHFIGNSINAIQQFFFPPDPANGSRYTSVLTRLLRRTMEYSELHFTTIDDEIKYIKDFLSMVKLRLGSKFNYTVECASDVDLLSLFPVMILQPIIENATIHGLAPKGHTLLDIKFKKERNKIICSITDNGVGIETRLIEAKNQPDGKESKGNILIQKKIQMLNEIYSVGINFDTIDLSKSGGMGTKVTIECNVFYG
jgi:hypothetical protein